MKTSPDHHERERRSQKEEGRYSFRLQKVTRGLSNALQEGRVGSEQNRSGAVVVAKGQDRFAGFGNQGRGFGVF